MSLRLKLLLLGLATLVLPWAGCRYAREMESALRDGEVDSLQGVSQTIAASLQVVFEEAAFHVLCALHKRTGLSRPCLKLYPPPDFAGGRDPVTLGVVANGLNT